MVSENVTSLGPQSSWDLFYLEREGGFSCPRQPPGSPEVNTSFNRCKTLQLLVYWAEKTQERLSASI